LVDGFQRSLRVVTVALTVPLGKIRVQRHQGERLSTTASVDETCAAFRTRLSEDALTPHVIHRMVIGEDAVPRVLSSEEAAAELGDLFATALLLKGRFPRTAGEVLAFFGEVARADGRLSNPLFFMVGEGSQIPNTPTAFVDRKLRFLVALGTGSDGPDVLISSFSPDEENVELMAWDLAHGGFNYYRTVGSSTGWVFAGNSRHALSDPTQGKGPFESHTSGNFLMKELRSPWIHWDSPAAQIFPTVFDGPPHDWFNRKDLTGALTCETSVARPSIARWTKARFDALVAGGRIDDPARIMRQLLDTPTVNIISSHTESRNAAAGSVELPQTFFVDSEALSEVLGLRAPPSGFHVSGSIYTQSLQTFGVRLTDTHDEDRTDGKPVFERPGDTHFAFCVPERALEDSQVLREARRIGLVSDRLAACLLMTDFANPIFSVRRRALLAHVPATATLADGASSFSQQMADTILAAAETSPEGSAEREFAGRWAVGEDFKAAFDGLLSDYYTAITERLQTQEGYDNFFRLAESRRERVEATMPIAESPLLFARARTKQGALTMLPNATVVAET
jgi:hypothetical protein